TCAARSDGEGCAHQSSLGAAARGIEEGAGRVMIRVRILQLGLVCAAIVVFELLCRFGIMDRFTMIRPSEMARALAHVVAIAPWFWPVRPQPNARSVGQPEPAALGLLMGNLEPLTLPDTLDPLVVDCPAPLAQQRGDLAIAVAAVLPGKLAYIGGVTP